jgi:hypothetical protein
MRAASKLRPIGDLEQPQVGNSEGWIVKVGPARKAEFRDETGRLMEVRLPRAIDPRWLAAATAIAPVPGIVAFSDGMRSPVLWCVFPEPAHEVLDEHLRFEGKSIALAASESVNIRTGKSTITVTAAGEIQVRGRNILSRASNLNRIRGGGVRIN